MYPHNKNMLKEMINSLKDGVALFIYSIPKLVILVVFLYFYEQITSFIMWFHDKLNFLPDLMIAVIFFFLFAVLITLPQRILSYMGKKRTSNGK